MLETFVISKYHRYLILIKKENKGKGKLKILKEIECFER